MTALEAFTNLIRDHVGPALRADGFKGSGVAFTLPEPAHWVNLGFQKSRYSDSEDVKFTVNLTVVSKATWAAQRQAQPYLPERPAANTRYGTFAWQRRIGLLMPDGIDHWWTVHSTTNLPDLAADVLQWIRSYGLPAIRANLPVR
jgi:hypothetical protein